MTAVESSAQKQGLSRIPVRCKADRHMGAANFFT